jgi:hypothetical protein
MDSGAIVEQNKAVSGIVTELRRPSARSVPNTSTALLYKTGGILDNRLHQLPTLKSGV